MAKSEESQRIASPQAKHHIWKQCSGNIFPHSYVLMIVLITFSQVALHKFALYFDVEERLVPVTKESNYVLSVDEAIKLVDENTIAVVAILGSTFTGHFEPVKVIAFFCCLFYNMMNYFNFIVQELNEALTELNKKNGWDVGIHIDAASGGFVAPFLYSDLEWDFRVPLVRRYCFFLYNM